MKDIFFYLMFNSLTVIFMFFNFPLTPLSPNIFFCFSKHQGAVFFFFLLLLLLSSVLLHHKGGNFFLEYSKSNWSFYIGYHFKISCPFLYFQVLVH